MSRSEEEPRSPAAEEARGGSRRRWIFALVALLLVAGVVLERLGYFDWHTGLALAERYSDRWWLAPALAVVTAALYAASLPGSLMVFVAAILLPPVPAALAFVAGAVAGALGAYSLARLAAKDGERSGATNRLFRLLAERSDLVTLTAVRLVPGFPHSAINVAAGLLAVPRGRFLLSTALGHGIKGTLYVAAIHRASQVASIEEAISWRTMAPLALISLVLFVVPPLLRRLRGLRPAATPPVDGD